MQNIVINNEVVTIQSLVEDVIESVGKGFQGFGKFTPDAVMQLAIIVGASDKVDKDVPKDYIEPNWNGKNRLYEWKNYIPQNQQAAWESMPTAQKAILAKEANKKAMMESWEY